MGGTLEAAQVTASGSAEIGRDSELSRPFTHRSSLSGGSLEATRFTSSGSAELAQEFDDGFGHNVPVAKAGGSGSKSQLGGSFRSLERGSRRTGSAQIAVGRPDDNSLVAPSVCSGAAL